MEIEMPVLATVNFMPVDGILRSAQDDKGPKVIVAVNESITDLFFETP